MTKINKSDGFSQNKAYTKNVNYKIEYINANVRKTTDRQGQIALNIGKCSLMP